MYSLNAFNRVPVSVQLVSAIKHVNTSNVVWRSSQHCFLQREKITVAV